MKKPCKICVVQAGCSLPCKEYAKWIYHSGVYKAAGRWVDEHISGMSYEEAIDHILKVECISTFINRIAGPEIIDQQIAEK